MNSNRKIMSRTYYTINVITSSPINISNGVSIETDADVMRNGQEELFIPGTSLAGAFRNYLGDDKTSESVFGFSAGEKGNMSSVFISDLYFEDGSVNMSVRDRVRLTKDKNVDKGGKFDLEIIEPGAKGSFTLETVVRDNMPISVNNPDDTVTEILLALDEGDIRLGSVKNRGFGRVRVDSVSVISFSGETREEWIKYLNEEAEGVAEAIPFAEWKNGKNRNMFRYERYIIPLTLTGGISIRRYSAQPNRADFEHITSNGVPVIPGTSWNGAIRADARQLIKDMGKTAGIPENQISQIADSLIDIWFGKVKGKAEKDAQQSMIVVSESEINGSKSLPMTRNNINRFTAGTKDGALYTEIAYIGGTTSLEYMIPRENEVPENNRTMIKALSGIMRLVVRDICEGFVAVGGQVSVGRGIFNGDYEKWEATLPDDRDECLKALYNVIKGRSEKC